MKLVKWVFPVLVFAVAGCNQISTNKKQSVNAIIGDLSYQKAFHQLPTAKTNENLRIQTHLAYVEKVLRQTDISDLSPLAKEKRAHLLDLLHEYRLTGAFPKNYDYPDQHRPCFIDKDGNICAVGYLIEQTAGRATAEKINDQYQYEYLMAMNDPLVDDWIANSGLTKKECAMIQPSYGPAPTQNYIAKDFGVSSALLTGVNLSVATVNGIQLLKGTNSKIAPYVGLITGATQITLGAFNYPETTYNFINGTPSINESQQKLSLVNMGLGTFTMVLSGWNLLSDKTPNEKEVSWNVFSYPTETNQVGLGFSLAKRF